jgi:TP901 family phage tail tape measure protein
MKISEWYLKMSENVGGGLNKINALADRVAARFSSLQDKVAGFQSKIKESINEIPGLGRALDLLKNPVALVLAGTVLLSSGLGKGIEKAAEFQQTVAEVSAITGIAGNDLKFLSDSALDVGVKSGLGAAKAAEAYKLLASNIDVATIGGVKGLAFLQEKTITLAQAANVDLPTAANTMAAAINQFGFSASQAGRVINTLAAGAKYGAAEIPDLAESLKDAGSTANLAGVSIESTVGALEILSQSALKGGEAGHQFKNVLLALETKAIPGVNLKTDGLSKTLQKLVPHINNTTLLVKMFGRENINAAQLLIKNADAVENMTKRVTGTNVAMEQAEIQMGTYQGTLNRFKAAIDGLFIRLGTPFLSPLTGLMNFLLNHKETIISALKGIGLGIGFIAVNLLVFYADLLLATPILWAFNAVMAANPVMILVIGISALIAVIYTLWQRCEKFRGFLYGLWDSVKQVFQNIWSAGKQYLGGLAELLVGIFTLDISKIKSGLKDAFTGVKSLYLEAGKGVAEKFNSGFKEGVMDVRNGKANKSSTSVSAADLLSGKGSASKKGNEDVGESVSAVSSGGRSVRNVIVTINNLVEGLVINVKQAGESADQITKIVEEAILRAINGAEGALANE